LTEELKKFDIEALSPLYKTAHCALTSDIEGFFVSVENAVKVDKVTETAFAEWPVFRELRNHPGFEEETKVSL